MLNDLRASGMVGHADVRVSKLGRQIVYYFVFLCSSLAMQLPVYMLFNTME